MQFRLLLCGENLFAALANAGLRYEDVLNENVVEVQTALSRMSKSEKTARIRRLKRALDLSFKRKYLPPSMQAELTDDVLFGHAVRDAAAKVRVENEERELLNL